MSWWIVVPMCLAGIVAVAHGAAGDFQAGREWLIIALLWLLIAEVRDAR